MAWQSLANSIFAFSVILSGCQAKADVQTGVQHQTLHVGSLEYPLLTFVPEAAKTAPVPVVIVLHGHGGTGDRAFTRLGLDTISAEKGFIVLAPSGRDKRWWDFEPGAEQDADFNMIEQLLDMAPKLGGDPKRIYLIGFSNGGNMSMVAGGHFADRIAAIGSGGSTIGRLNDDMEYQEIPKPKRSIPIVLFHGMEDDVISYDMGTFSISTPDSTAWWAREDGISSTPSHEELASGDILRDTYYGRDGLQVMMLSYKKLGHDWPNVIDKDTGVVFNEELWKFLSQYSLK